MHKQILENTRLGAAPKSSPAEVLCKICKGDHPTKKCKPRPQGRFLQLARSSPSGEVYKGCRQEAHMFTHHKSQKLVASTRVVSCPKFSTGDKAKRDQILTEAKKKHDVCKHCLGFTHKSDDCNLTYTCKI